MHSSKRADVMRDAKRNDAAVPLCTGELLCLLAALGEKDKCALVHFQGGFDAAGGRRRGEEERREKIKTGRWGKAVLRGALGAAVQRKHVAGASSSTLTRRQRAVVARQHPFNR